MNDQTEHVTIVGVEVDGTMYTQGAVAALVKRNRDMSETNQRLTREAMAFRGKVASVFTEMVSDGTLSKEDANEALDELGLDKLSTQYTADLTITATVAFESSEDADEVTSMLETDMSVDLDHYSLGSFDVHNVRVEVDRVDVDEL